MGMIRGLTTTSTRKRKQSLKSSSKRTSAAIEHDKWLRKMGAHPDQRGRTTGVNSIPSYKTREAPALSNRVVPIDPYQGMSAAEKIAATQSVELGQLYNKGGIQVIGKSDNAAAGKRRA